MLAEKIICLYSSASFVLYSVDLSVVLALLLLSLLPFSTTAATIDPIMRRKVFVLKHNSKRYPVFYYPSSGGKEFLRENIMKHFPVFQKRKLKVVPVIQNR